MGQVGHSGVRWGWPSRLVSTALEGCLQAYHRPRLALAPPRFPTPRFHTCAPTVPTFVSVLLHPHAPTHPHLQPTAWSPTRPLHCGPSGTGARSSEWPRRPAPPSRAWSGCVVLRRGRARPEASAIYSLHRACYQLLKALGKEVAPRERLPCTVGAAQHAPACCRCPSHCAAEPHMECPPRVLCCAVT